MSTATVTLTIDMSGFHAALEHTGQHLRAFGLAADGTRHAGDVARAGREARWFVRGGFSPDYADPARRDRMARALARASAPHLAASLLRGWSEHRPVHRDEVLPCLTGCQYGADVGIPFGGPCTLHDDYADHLGAGEPIDHPRQFWSAAIVERYVRGWKDAGRACRCTMTDPRYWFTYGSAVEPGSQWEQGEDCPVHPLTLSTGLADVDEWDDIIDDTLTPGERAALAERMPF